MKRNQSRQSAVAETESESQLSVLGKVLLSRRYYECLPCRLPECPADVPLGLEGRYAELWKLYWKNAKMCNKL
jgi:hypothetical protein